MKERFSLNLPKVVAVSISPKDSWLTTITPFKQEPNLQVWDLKTGELHYSFVQHSYSRTVCSLESIWVIGMAIRPMGLVRNTCSFPFWRNCTYISIKRLVPLIYCALIYRLQFLTVMICVMSLKCVSSAVEILLFSLERAFRPIQWFLYLPPLPALLYVFPSNSIHF